ncbi:MAG: hypothetical protein MI919_16395 [Holophagales bacterium]|nr:hypothetical protein [Holophagales bacterium]
MALGEEILELIEDQDRGRAGEGFDLLDSASETEEVTLLDRPASIDELGEQPICDSGLGWMPHYRRGHSRAPQYRYQASQNRRRLAGSRWRREPENRNPHT